MKKQYFIYGSIVVLVAVGILLYQQVIKPQLDNRTISVTVPMFMENEELSYAFTFPSGEDAYALIEPPFPPENADGIKQVYLIMGSKAYIDFQASTDSEAPPTVSVFVFKMPDEIIGAVDDSRAAKLDAWAKQFSRYTSYELRTSEPEAIEVDGVKGVSYTTDGLYQQQVYLFSYQGNVYMFTGQYDSESDPIRGMFADLVGSIEFY